MKLSYNNLLISSVLLHWDRTKQFARADDEIFRIDYLPFANVRLDPIINQDCLSDHVHTFYGAQTLFPNLTYADLINTPAKNSTATLEENKSLYWHPSVYAYDSETDTYKLDSINLTTTYYLWGKDARAFPNGFRMVAGYNEKSIREGWNCGNERPCDKQDCSAPPNWKFPTTRCSELELSMLFPNCWDGVNLDSDDHMKHVAYSLGEETEDLSSAPCPETHPVRLPLINFFVRIFDYDGGFHTFSDGSDIFHADYVSGWDEDHLQSVLDHCRETDDSETTEGGVNCDELLTYRLNKFDFEEERDFVNALKRIQPPNILDTTYLTNEVVNNVAKLPRGACEGELLWDGSRNATYLANNDDENEGGDQNEGSDEGESEVEGGQGDENSENGEDGDDTEEEDGENEGEEGENEEADEGDEGEDEENGDVESDGDEDGNGESGDNEEDSEEEDEGNENGQEENESDEDDEEENESDENNEEENEGDEDGEEEDGSEDNDEENEEEDGDDEESNEDEGEEGDASEDEGEDEEDEEHGNIFVHSEDNKRESDDNEDDDERRRKTLRNLRGS